LFSIPDIAIGVWALRPSARLYKLRKPETSPNSIIWFLDNL